MKRLMLLFFFSSTIALLFAQTTAVSPVKALKMKDKNSCNDGYTAAHPAAYNQTTQYYIRNHQGQAHSGTRALSYFTLGKSGNLFTILDAEVNRLAANQDINSVVFIHRANPVTGTNLNVAQFMYDLSTDGGTSFTDDHGPLNPDAENVFVSGRYPNVALYNPANNTNPANAYLSYVGAWLPFNNGTTTTTNWKGFYAGVAKLDNDTTTFTENVTTFNNSNVLIAKGLCNGLPGIFWAVDFSYNGTDVDGLLLYQGVWNPTSHDVVWNLFKKFTPTFERNFDGKSHAAAVNVSFDPTGRYGWMVFLGNTDNTVGHPGYYKPVFYNTTDGGANWSGPQSVDLRNIPIVASHVDTLNPTTAFDVDIVVDYLGNPHAVTLVGAGVDYTILTGGASQLNMFDITLNSKKEWSAILLDSVATFRGNITTSLTEENRPQASSTADGKFISFGWLDSDPTINAGDNNVPNLFSRGLDVTTGLADLTVNHTGGDARWDKLALFSSFAPTSFKNGTTVNIPTVVAELNPQSLSENDPANFYYLNGINHITTNMTNDVTAPTITLVGCNPYTVVVNGTYTEPGATADDNKDGNITANIQTSGTVNTAAAGTYTKTYTVTDANGNQYTTTRTINVVTVANGTAPTITLNGASTVHVNKCGYFNDLGATASDVVDGNITNKVTNNAGTLPLPNGTTAGTPGTYTLTYSVTSCSSGLTSTVNRTVIVDSTSIAITLSGNAVDSIQPCTSYADLGASAYDQCTGPIAVTVSSTLNTAHPGTYVIRYVATNGSESDTATRTVFVESDTTAPSASFAAGSNPTYVYLGTTYTDANPSASDCSGIAGITSDANTAVNTTSRGTDTVTYVITDSSGNSVTLKRLVVINTEPDPQFTVSFPTNTSVRFTDASLYNPTSWVWDFGDGQGSTLQNTNHLYTAHGTYTVCLTAKNIFNAAPFNKPAVPKCDTIQYTGIQDIAMDSYFNVYPNPTTGQVTLDVDAAGFDKMTVSITTMVGANISTFTINQVPAQSKYFLDMSSYAKGVYMLKIQTEKGSVTKKVTLIK